MLLQIIFSIFHENSCNPGSLYQWKKTITFLTNEYNFQLKNKIENEEKKLKNEEEK